MCFDYENVITRKMSESNSINHEKSVYQMKVGVNKLVLHFWKSK